MCPFRSVLPVDPDLFGVGKWCVPVLRAAYPPAGTPAICFRETPGQCGNECLAGTDESIFPVQQFEFHSQLDLNMLSKRLFKFNILVLLCPFLPCFSLPKSSFNSG